MFEVSNLFALMDNGSGRRSFRVERVSLDEDTRSDLVTSFSEQSMAFVYSDGVAKEIRDYYPGYTADTEDEINRIGGFELPQQIAEALGDSLSLPICEPL